MSDLLSISGIQTDYQWAILSQANTGTGLHLDPDYTVAWNSLLTGVKYWALLPLEAWLDIRTTNNYLSPKGSSVPISGGSEIAKRQNVLINPPKMAKCLLKLG